MTALPVEDKLVALIDDATAGYSDFRPHLGASIIGHHCDRYLWLVFRWTFKEKFDGRIKRLFRRGHNEENTVVSDLKDAGLKVSECLHQQKTHYIAPHVGVTPDGVVEWHPEAPKKRHSLEIKTHSLKSFNEVSKDGVLKAKPMHYAQMHCEMKAQNTDRALYVAVCKDDDRIYTERIHMDWDVLQSIVDRGSRIVFSDRMPEPCSGASPSWYQCKMCGASDMCHGSKLTKQVNCRTCAHSTAKTDDSPVPKGLWHCSVYDCEIPLEGQMAGCESHTLHPDMVPWKLDAEASTKTIAVYIINGKPVANGEADANIYGSAELIANASACCDPDPMMQELRESFGARVTG